MSEPLDLLPCPFCGGKAEYDNDTGPNDEGFASWIACNDCGAKTYDREDWNRRTPSPVGTAPLREEIGHLLLDLAREENNDATYWDWDEPDQETRIAARESWMKQADRILALLPRSAPTLKGAPADDHA